MRTRPVSRTTSGTTGVDRGSIESERLEPAAELCGARLEVRESRPALGGVRDVDRLHRRCCVCRAQRIGINVGIGFLPHGLDGLGACRDESTVHPERLPERADKNVDAGAAMLLGATSCSSVGRDAVRVVHDRDDSVPETGVVLARECRDRVNRSVSPRMLKMPSKMTMT